MAITNSQYQSIIAYHMNGIKRQEIADKTGVAYNTVKSKIKDYEKNGIREDNSKNEVLQKECNKETLLQEIANIKQEQNKQLLDIIRNDIRPVEIVSKILDIMNNDDELALEVTRKGLGGLNTVFGTITDKAFKYEEVMIRREAMNLNNKIYESYDPGNDNFKKAMAKQLKGIDNVNFDKFIEDESKKEPDV